MAALATIASLLIIRTEAFTRAPITDDELVARSDSIVIGHLVGPIQKMAFLHDSLGDEFDVYPARLSITAVIAGRQPIGETPILIHYGLRPVLLVSHRSLVDTMNPPSVPSGDSTLPIGIVDTAMAAGMGSFSDDLRQDHLWFLRRKAQGPSGGSEPTNYPGIASPEDIEPLSERAYFEAIVKGDPAGLEQFIDQEQWRLQRIEMTQTCLKIREISRIPDLSARVDALLPYWEKVDFSSSSKLALDKIFECGSVGAAKLVPEFEHDDGVPDRRFVLEGWRKMNYPLPTPVLISFLKRQLEWWKSRSLADKEFGEHGGQRGGPLAYDDPRVISFRDMYCVIEDMVSKDALPVIAEIRDEWKSVKFDSNNDLLGVCDSALSRIR